MGKHGDYICNTIHNHGALIAGGSLVSCVTKWGIRRISNPHHDDVPNVEIDGALVNMFKKLKFQDWYQPFKLLNVLKDYNATQYTTFQVNGNEFFKRYSPRTDFDIYVPQAAASSLCDHLMSAGFRETKRYIPTYDPSFMKQNGITEVIRLKRRNMPYEQIDVMSCVKNVGEIVINFDLSFCEIWSDGHKCYMEDSVKYTDLMNMKGVLKNGYIEKYLEGNKFICDRARKYCFRGFHVSFPLPKYDVQVLKPYS